MLEMEGCGKPHCGEAHRNRLSFAVVHAQPHDMGLVIKSKKVF